MSENTKKDPVDNNEINTLNQIDYSMTQTSGEEINLSDPEQMKKIAKVSGYLAKKYHGLIVTDGRDGRKSANDAYHEINKFWKLIDETRKKEKQEALAEYEDMKKRLDQALAPLLQIKDELKKARRESREESRQAEWEKRHDENKKIALEMAESRDINHNVAIAIVNKHYREVTDKKQSKIKREKIIAELLDKAIKNGFSYNGKIINAKTGLIEKQTVNLRITGNPAMIKSLMRILFDIKSLKVIDTDLEREERIQILKARLFK